MQVYRLTRGLGLPSPPGAAGRRPIDECPPERGDGGARIASSGQDGHGKSHFFLPGSVGIGDSCMAVWRGCRWRGVVCGLSSVSGRRAGNSLSLLRAGWALVDWRFFGDGARGPGGRERPPLRLVSAGASPLVDDGAGTKVGTSLLLADVIVGESRAAGSPGRAHKRATYGDIRPYITRLPPHAATPRLPSTCTD